MTAPLGSPSNPIQVGYGVTYIAPNASNLTVNAAGADTLTGGNNDTLTVATSGNTLTGGNYNSIVINGGNNTITLLNSDTVVINDARTEANGFSGTVTYGDTVAMQSNGSLTLNYTLNLGNSDVVSANFNPLLTLGNGSSAAANYIINAGTSDSIAFSGSGQAVVLNAGGSNTLTTTGSNDTITIGNSATANSSASTGGACSNGIIMTVGQTAAGTTFNGGLGTDTFTAGAGYDGGNNYIGSTGTNAQLFNAGNCVNYSGLSCRVTVNYNTGVGQGYDANGNLLWTDTYNGMEQVKGAKLDGNVLTGSNTYFNELKGGLGQTTYYDGTAGARVIWGEAGATGLLDGQGTDIAHLGNGDDEIYWRNQPSNSKGVSNFGETAYGFNVAQGSDLNFTELATAGYAGVSHSFAGTAADATNWVNVSLASNGQDTNVWFDKSGSGNFTQIAVTLKGDNLFADFGVNSHPQKASAQVVQDMFNAGNLVLNQTH
ncbi:MAG: hypothetical protein JO038_07425 [Alphaproteobacteria bacterium]|nr:hypothetical protein [Alphaproteobacteria bacterium]